MLRIVLAFPLVFSLLRVHPLRTGVAVSEHGDIRAGTDNATNNSLTPSSWGERPPASSEPKVNATNWARVDNERDWMENVGTAVDVIKHVIKPRIITMTVNNPMTRGKYLDKFPTREAEYEKHSEIMGKPIAGWLRLGVIMMEDLIDDPHNTWVLLDEMAEYKKHTDSQKKWHLVATVKMQLQYKVKDGFVASIDLVETFERKLCKNAVIAAIELKDDPDLNPGHHGCDLQLIFSARDRPVAGCYCYLKAASAAYYTQVQTNKSQKISLEPDEGLAQRMEKFCAPENLEGEQTWRFKKLDSAVGCNCTIS